LESKLPTPNWRALKKIGELLERDWDIKLLRYVVSIIDVPDIPNRVILDYSQPPQEVT